MSIKATIDDAIFCAKAKLGKTNCMNCRLFEEDAGACAEVIRLQLEVLEECRAKNSEPAWKKNLLQRFMRSE